MDERKLIFQNIAMLDIRRAESDARRLPDRLENVALLICSESTDLAQMELENVASVVRVPAGVELKMQNGQVKIAASDEAAGKVFLMVNGQCEIAGDVTADMLLERYAGIMVNGQAICPRSLAGALSGRLQINGQMKLYPDGAILRLGETVRLDADAARSMQPGLYAVKRVIALDADAARTACERGLRFFADEAVCAHSARGPLYELMSECAPRVTEAPDGFVYIDELAEIDRIKARRLRGRLFVDGDVELAMDLPAGELRLDALHVTGRLTLTSAQLDGLGDADLDCGSLRLREPGDIAIDGDYSLSAAALEALDGQRKLWVDGDLTLDADVTPELIRGRFSRMSVAGDVYAMRALWATAAALGDVSGEFRPLPEPESGAGEPDVPRDPDAIYVENVVSYQY